MDIVRNIQKLIKRYLAKYRDGKLKKPKYCKICGRICKLIWHAEYIRKLITLCGIYYLPIKRLYCPICKHTFALLPEFIEKFHRYAKDVIAFGLRELQRKISYKEIADKLAKLLEPNEIYVEPITLYNWKKKFCPI